MLEAAAPVALVPALALMTRLLNTQTTRRRLRGGRLLSQREGEGEGESEGEGDDSEGDEGECDESEGEEGEGEEGEGE